MWERRGEPWSASAAPLINLRYHIVSLVAVFLALGIGIVMGATVIDRVTVEALNNRIESVRRSVEGTRADNRRLNSQLGTIRDFADQARDPILRGQLEKVPVMVIAVTGTDRKPVDALGQALVGSGAAFQGTVWFNPKSRLENEDDVRALSAALGSDPARPEVVLGQALDRLAATALPSRGSATPTGTAPTSTTVAGATVAGARPGAGSPLGALRAAGFVAYEAPPAEESAATIPSDLSALPLAGTRFVVVSGAGAQVGDDILSVPLTRSLVGAGIPVVAVESGQDSPGGRAVFVGLLRADGNVSSRLSTVDNLESPMGQAAAVLALDDLAIPRYTHLGVGPGAQRLLPAPPA